MRRQVEAGEDCKEGDECERLAEASPTCSVGQSTKILNQITLRYALPRRCKSCSPNVCNEIKK